MPTKKTDALEAGAEKTKLQQLLEAMLADQKLMQTRQNVATGRLQFKHQSKKAGSQQAIARKLGISPDSIALGPKDLLPKMVSPEDLALIVDGKKIVTEVILRQIVSDFDLRGTKRTELLTAGNEHMSSGSTPRLPSHVSGLKSRMKPMPKTKKVLAELVKGRAYERKNDSIHLQESSEELPSHSGNDVIPLSISCLRTKFDLCSRIIYRITEAARSPNEIYESDITELMDTMHCSEAEQRKFRDAIKADGVPISAKLSDQETASGIKGNGGKNSGRPGRGS